MSTAVLHTVSGQLMDSARRVVEDFQSHFQYNSDRTISPRSRMGNERLFRCGGDMELEIGKRLYDLLMSVAVFMVVFALIERWWTWSFRGRRKP